MSQQFAEISGLELARVGNWSGREITEGDLDAAVAAWEETHDTEPIGWCMDHEEKGESRGTVGKLWTEIRDGVKVLVGDVANIPDSIMEAIRERRILGRSIALVRNREFGAKTYPAMLRHVSWLGSAPQGVKGMPALATYLSEKAEDTVECLYLETPEINAASGDTTEARDQASPATTETTETETQESDNMSDEKVTIEATETPDTVTLAEFKEQADKLEALREELRGEKTRAFSERCAAREAEWAALGLPVDAMKDAGIAACYGEHDTVVTFSDTETSQLDRLDTVLKQIAKAGITKLSESAKTAAPVKPCSSDETEFLGWASAVTGETFSDVAAAEKATDTTLTAWKEA